jgi:hypothetical protein
MARDSLVRFYATLKTTPDLLSVYRGKDLEDLTRFTVRLLRETRHKPAYRAEVIEHPQSAAGLDEGFKAVAAPSLDWRAAFVPPPDATVEHTRYRPGDTTPDELVIAFEAQSEAVAQAFLGTVNALRHVVLDANGNSFHGAGFDPGGSIADHWCPGPANLAAFGHRHQARRTIRAGALAQHHLLGQRVNVAIIDEGLDRSHIPHQNWGGGLDHLTGTTLVQSAGTAPRTSHGMMIARSILDLAPHARLYDVPALAFKIPKLPVFISTLQSAYENLLHAIRQHRVLPHWSGPWVLVNAWAVFDSNGDPSGSYTQNTEAHGHPLLNLVTRAVHSDRMDVVFAAGNCGLFCPSRRCGARDRGPGHSIWGANAHPLVITAGAVRSDETWLGYSSQGPGPALLAHNKPDLCAPSQFCETHDAAALSSGTSAACAMAAGVVAALRGNPRWDQTSLPPDALKAALILSARKPHGPPGWDDRMGHGIIDAAAAIATLPP